LIDANLKKIRQPGEFNDCSAGAQAGELNEGKSSWYEIPLESELHFYFLGQ
jgi:hypothetical protein